jgi:hypothetical protein
MVRKPLTLQAFGDGGGRAAAMSTWREAVAAA